MKTQRRKTAFHLGKCFCYFCYFYYCFACFSYAFTSLHSLNSVNLLVCLMLKVNPTSAWLIFVFLLFFHFNTKPNTNRITQITFHLVLFLMSFHFIEFISFFPLNFIAMKCFGCFSLNSNCSIG